MENEKLVEQLKVVLASVFSVYLKAHNYHWNVVGPNFAQYHDFFGTVYQDIHASVDDFAEQIRILGAVSPGSLKRFSELSIITDEIAVPSPKFMFIRLASDNLAIIDQLKTTRKMAEEVEEYALVSFLEARLEYHKKLQWMLTSFES